MDVTDGFAKYARPLIGDEWLRVPLENGVQRFARIEKKLAAKKCKSHVPMVFR